MCYIGYIDIIYIYWQESLDSTVEGPTRIARLRLERKKERKPTRIHSEVVGTKNLTDRNYVKKRSQNQEI